ncbi:hypothetical protein MNV49_006315 [Pseudohyphozyma bogoriensis]|nr:hypothetical protein MNV49_006315 [Pseudohyphozyma bogoriensis]
MPDPLTLLKYSAYGAGFTAVTLGGLLYSFQTSLIYPANIPSGTLRSRTNVPKPTDFGMPYEDVDLTTPDGVSIKAYLILAKSSDADKFDSVEKQRTVILFHANAGNVGHRLPIAKVFWSKMGCNVFCLSYRGYGHSEGTPNEKGLRLDAQTALDHVLSHPTLSKTQIYLYGQSIGGAVSIDTASRNVNRLKGLIIENTFLSLPLLVPTVMPYLTPFIPFLLHQIWPSNTSIAKLPPSFPVLFLKGGSDELIPQSHMLELWRIYREGGGEGEKEKREEVVGEWAEFKDGTHNDTCLQPNYFSTIHRFLQRHSPSSSDPPLRPSPHPSSSSTSTIRPSTTSSTQAEDDYLEFEDDLPVDGTGAGSLDPKEVAERRLREVERKLDGVEEGVRRRLAEKGDGEL